MAERERNFISSPQAMSEPTTLPLLARHKAEHCTRFVGLVHE
jgi:hypothetical protein